jgi:hypothetical protein
MCGVTASRWDGVAFCAYWIPDTGYRDWNAAPRWASSSLYSALLFSFSLSFRHRATPSFLLGPGFVVYPFCAKHRAEEGR